MPPSLLLEGYHRGLGGRGGVIVWCGYVLCAGCLIGSWLCCRVIRGFLGRLGDVRCGVVYFCGLALVCFGFRLMNSKMVFCFVRCFSLL